MTLSVLAWDLSLTSTGVCTPTGLRRLQPKHTGVDRLAYYRHAFEEITREAEPDLIVVEELPPSTGGKYDMNGLAMAQAVFQLKMYDLGLAVTFVNPSILKKYATGNGNAGKPQVVAEAVRRLGYQGHSNDEADSLWLWTMGVDHLTDESLVPAAQRAALDKIAWRLTT